MEVAATTPRGGLALRAFAATLVAASLFAGNVLADGASAPKVLRVATSGDYAPFSFEKPGAPEAAVDGFDVEVATRFARDRGYRLEIVRFRWPDLSRELAAGSFDIAMSGVTVRPERSIAGRFSVPVAATQAVVLSWKGSGVANLAELDKPGRRVAVNAGGHLEKVARQSFRRAEILAIADNAAVGMSLLDRTADAVLTDNFEEKVWTAAAPDAVRLGSLSDDRKAYLLPAGSADLGAEIDRWLLAREKDGTLAELRRRYFQGDGAAAPVNGDESATTAEPVAALAAAVRERLALMPLVYEAKKREGKAIEDKTQEAAVLDGAVRAVAAAAAEAGSPGVSAGAMAPDAEAVRALFDVLISIGKDAQQKLADTDARQRPGSISNRTKDIAPVAAGEPPSNDAQAPEEKPPVRITGPDLARDIRPAIARISDKIARVLVAMDEPVSARAARSRLEASLASQGVQPDRLDAMAEAVARISSRTK